MSRASMSSGSSTAVSGNVSPLEEGPFARLTESQNQAFFKLKNLVETNDAYWPDPSEGLNNAQEINDHTLLRYLRARQYDPQAAYNQYIASGQWRRKLSIDSYYDNEEVSNFEATRRLFPEWTGRRSISGHPVFVYQVSAVKTSDLLSTSKSDPDLKTIFLPAEHSMNFIMPVCSRLHPSGTISDSINIIDLSGVGPRTFWNMRSHLQKASTMATSHYPETVERIFIVGAPSFFTTIWGFIIKWFDKATTGKIDVLAAGEIAERLTKYIRKEDLPKRYGGDLEWEYGDQPCPDDQVMKLLGEKMGEAWVEGPMRCVQTIEGEIILALGKDEGKVRREILASHSSRTVRTSESLISEK